MLRSLSRPPERRKVRSTLLPLFAACTAIYDLLIFALLPLRAVVDLVLAVWSHRSSLLFDASLKDVSATLQQIDVRIEQVLSTPSQFRRMQQYKQTDLSVSRSQYIAVYNMLWLIANDIIVGSAVAAVLTERADDLGARIASLLDVYAVAHVLTGVRWLTEWPLGIKLNDELGSFFRDALLWLTGFWSAAFIVPLVRQLPLVVSIVGLSGWLGTTMSLSIASDLLALSTMHLYAFHLLMTSLYRWHLRTIYSLQNIFRGRKYNVLRGRVEPHQYSVDQLLVGTVLFTLAAFLLPTVFIFHLYCASTRLLIIAMHAALETCLAFINHFPLFALLLRIKEPGRLPGGLRFAIEAKSGQLTLANQPVGMGAIFGRHVALSQRILAHYSPIDLVRKVLAGQPLRPIDRWQLRYAT